MELDLDFKTIAISLGMWLFIVFLVWFIPGGFKEIKIKVITTIIMLPVCYFMTLWQLNR